MLGLLLRKKKRPEYKEPQLWLGKDGELHGEPVDPNSPLVKLYAETDAHLILGVHVPGTIENKAVVKSILRHEGLNHRSLRSTI